jgi:rRNA-processing protein CGR1
MVKQPEIVGKPKSGRVWKTKQAKRSSAQMREGCMATLKKSFEEKERIRKQKKAVLEMEREMKDAKAQAKVDEKIRREEQQKRREANEFKNSVYQVVSVYTFNIKLLHTIIRFVFVKR